MASDNARVYMGRPYNQKDPAAVNRFRGNQAPAAAAQPPQNKQRPPGAKKVNPIDQIRNAPPTIPKPSHAHLNKPPAQPQADPNPLADSVFGVDVSVREVNLEQEFTPAVLTFTDISRLISTEMQIDDVNLSKAITPEMFDYYATAMLWARIITLKVKNSQPLSQPEHFISTLIQNVSYSIPEPLTLLFKSVGNLLTKSGEHFQPTFPVLPDTVIQGHGGYYGQIDAITHNLYEEIPCLGVAAEAVRQSVSDAPPGPYASVLAHPHHAVNENLLNYRPLGFRRNEAKNIAFSVGITPVLFPETVPHTAYNHRFLANISALLADNKTFKISSICFSQLAESGSVAQTLVPRPIQRNEIVTRCVDQETYVTGMCRETIGSFGGALVFGFQTWKSDFAPDPITRNNWCCLTSTQNHLVPIEWRNNRNARRNLPTRYYDEPFRNISHDGDQYRRKVVESLTITKR